MAQYDWLYDQKIYDPWVVDYDGLSDDEKFEKLFRYVLELEKRIEQLENNND